MTEIERNYEILSRTGGKPVKAWIRGVPLEEAARRQLLDVAQLPIVYRWVAAMPDVHWGIGATVGCVIPTVGAIVPAAVGVDIGCGMMALRTTLDAARMPDGLRGLRDAIEGAVPHGRTHGGGKGDHGAWQEIPPRVRAAWASLEPRYRALLLQHPKLDRGNDVNHLGTLGTGNHFIEICLDESQRVWLLLHSGSRGVGNRIGSYFIELARQDMRRTQSNLPDIDLAYFREGSRHFDTYVEAVNWAQDYALANRQLLMASAVEAIGASGAVPAFEIDATAVNCHHNYVARETHYGQEVWVTRKGAVRARSGDLGIVPGSMGAASFIVRGRGNPESFESCSHGAGRAMSRNEARRRFTIEDHARMTQGIECRKDAGVIDETPAAYKSIEAVMRAQAGLVEIVHTLRQIVCVKG